MSDKADEAARARREQKIQRQLDEALADSFPASDPVSIVTSSGGRGLGEATAPRRGLTTRHPGEAPPGIDDLGRRQLQGGARLVDGGEHDRPPPDLVQVVEHLTAALQVKAAPVDARVVHELEGAVVAHVLRGDHRGAEVVFGREDRLVQPREVLLQHLHLAVAARVVAEQAELLGELAGEVIAHEAEVIVLLP